MRRIADYAKLAVFGLGVISSLGLAAPAQAVDTTLNVQVCGQAAISQLKITAPQSDTVFRESSIILEGELELVNQVEIYIDGNYHKTVAIPIGEAQFSTTVTLQAGTQTVEVRGVGVCDGIGLQDEIVVTYNPPVSPTMPTEPSEGSKTPTVTSPTPGVGSPSGGGVVVSNPNPTVEEATNTSGSWWQSLTDWLGDNGLTGWAIRLTDVDSTVQRLSADWLRVLAMIVGVGLLFGAGLKLKRRRRLALLISGSLLLLASVLIFL